MRHEMLFKKDHVFEVREKDLLGRIGKLHTKNGILDTPYLFPVVHPVHHIVLPEEILDIGFQAIMTNAFLARKAFGSNPEKKIHELLDFNGIVATDSGAYQILIYGGIETTQTEIIQFQEQICSDIAVILDVPTGLTNDREHAEATVKLTLQRADQAIKNIREHDILWVGPIQGGIHLDLVAESSKYMDAKGFPILALGSPTQIMEQYMYRQLVNMILTCKRWISPSSPLHLFGGGHPSMFALAVSLGCDLFDSASYAIYARNNRYLTPNGTIRFEDLEYLPCSCSICSKLSLKDIRDFPNEKRVRALAIHNLNICFEELRKIKQSIHEGRLWELVMQRARGHPRIFESIYELRKYHSLLERYSPISKNKGIFFFDQLDYIRPEIFRFKKRLIEEFTLPNKSKIMILLPPPLTKPYEMDKNILKIKAIIKKRKDVNICFYDIPYGLIPIELSDVYPITQTETSYTDNLLVRFTAEDSLIQYIKKSKYKTVILHSSDQVWSREMILKLRKQCLQAKSKMRISYYGDDMWSKEAMLKLNSILNSVKTKQKKRT
ncbi:tRNA guanosine(15) transglycosylase TgtA [[Eubacterium] cellulosolvens]